MLTTDEKIERIIENFKEEDKFKSKVEYIKEIPPKKGEYGYLNNLHPKIVNYLENNKIKLFKHQCKVFEHVKDGENVIITTPTASGKTLAFTLPVLDTFADDENATALYLYPAKALSSDQLQKLKEYEEETQIQLKPYKYDKDINERERPKIRSDVRVLITNPYMIHKTLFWHFQWCKFYSNLKYIIIDEAHTYRGIFGSNVALLIRRLMRICNYYGSDPQFILSSATLANPVEFGEKLIGKKVKLVSEDYSDSGKKTIVFFNPYNDLDTSIIHDTRDLVSMFVLNDIQTLCFTKTKRMAENISIKVKKYLEDVTKGTNKVLSNTIAPYRAQYPVQERRTIERYLKNRKYLGVISTNALELGIDIGSLDAVIISGYPGTLISTWQQAGRAGRRNNSSLVVLMGAKDPLNQFVIKNPSYVLEGSHENAAIDLDNEKIGINHLKCAASELPLNGNDFKLFNMNKSVMSKAGIYKRIFGWEYIKLDHEHFPTNIAREIDLKPIANEDFEILYNGNVLESLNREDAYLIAFKGAKHQYKGTVFVVKTFDHTNKKIFVKRLKKEIEYSINSEKRIDLRILNIIKTKSIGFLELYYGELELDIDFYKFEYDKGRKINFQKIDVPTLKFKTKGIWLNIPRSIIHDLIELEYDFDLIDQSVSGVENVLLTMFPLIVLCDKCDIGTYSTSYDDNINISIFLYDMYEDGIGLTEKCLDAFSDLIKISISLVEKCNCKEGCALCIYASSCGINRKKRNKKGTLFLLRKLLKEMKEEEINNTTRPEEEIIKFSEDNFLEVEQEIFNNISFNGNKNEDKQTEISIKDKTNYERHTEIINRLKTNKITDFVNSEKFNVHDDFSLPEFVMGNPYILERLHDIPCPKCGLTSLFNDKINNKIKCKNCDLILTQHN